MQNIAKHVAVSGERGLDAGKRLAKAVERHVGEAARVFKFESHFKFAARLVAPPSEPRVAAIVRRVDRVNRRIGGDVAVGEQTEAFGRVEMRIELFAGLFDIGKIGV